MKRSGSFCQFLFLLQSFVCYDLVLVDALIMSVTCFAVIPCVWSACERDAKESDSKHDWLTITSF